MTLCAKKEPRQFIKFFIKKFRIIFLNNKIYLCLNNANQPTACSENKKTFRKSKAADCLLKWDKDTMLRQVNASQNPRQMIDNIHNDFQPFAWIMTERFDNTKRSIYYYLRKESKKESREETTQNKADKLLASLQRDNQSRRQAKKIELSWNLTFTKLFCNR